MDFSANVIAYVTNPENAQQITDHLRTYYRDDRHGIPGRHFDEFAQRALPDRFDEVDIAALCCLNERPDAATLDDLMYIKVVAAGEMLARLDEQVGFLTIWDASPSVFEWPTSTLSTTFLFLRDQISGIGHTSASKLLACKYPELVPVRDVAVEYLLGAASNDSWWEPMQAAMTEQVRATLAQLTPDNVPGFVSLLRRLDVALWMLATHNPGTRLTEHGTLTQPGTPHGAERS